MLNVCLGSRKQGFCLNVAENFSPEIYVNRLLIVDFPDSIVKFCLHSKIVISTPRNFVTQQVTFYHHHLEFVSYLGLLGTLCFLLLKRNDLKNEKEMGM